jgi:hypothetical protein
MERGLERLNFLVTSLEKGIVALENKQGEELNKVKEFILNVQKNMEEEINGLSRS